MDARDPIHQDPSRWRKNGRRVFRIALVVLALVALTFSLDRFGGAAQALPSPSSEPVAVSAVADAVRARLAEAEPLVTSAGDTVSVDDRLAAYYSFVPDRLVWLDREGPKPMTRALSMALDDLEADGLDSELHLSGALEAALERAREDGSARERAEAEILASHAFLRAAADLSDGHLDPETLEDEARIAVQREAGIEQLERVRSGESPAAVLDDLRPDLPWYGYTREALRAYRAKERAGGWPRVELSPDELLAPGDSTDAVASLRARLAAGTSARERELASRRSGLRYDPDLVRAVELFQERHGIAIDGIVGGSTLAALNVGVADRAEELRLSLERMRWLPPMGAREIFVNAAGFELHVLENAEPVMSMRVVVGLPEWPTVIFSDTLEYVVLNPYWHVPQSIEQWETLPRLRSDPSYLADRHMVVVPESNNFADPVPLSAVDLSTFEGFDIRQEPGPHNALGQVKFKFPNPHNIYLHDTPATALFEENFRSASHGCIRVEHPIRLAEYVLDAATGRSSAEIPNILESLERTRVDLTVPIPVHIYYLTGWADADGEVHFHPDIYELNPPAERALEGADAVS